MEALFKQHFWLIRLAGSCAIVALAASAMSTQLGPSCVLVDEEIDPSAIATEDLDEEEEDPSAANDAMLRKALGSTGSSGASKTGIADAIVAHNVFCPTCAPIQPIATPSGGPVRPGEIRSSLPLQLLATMESEDPLLSLATIRDVQSETLGPYGIQDAVRPGIVIEEIGRGRVVLRNGAQLEYIELGAEVPQPVGPPKVPDEEGEPKGEDEAGIEGAEDAIKCDGENCTVDREFVEKILNNPGMLAKQARVVPAVKDGETRGFKFYGIRPGSLPKILGLKNGDLLTSVNGTELKSLDQAMELYTKLRRASHLSVTIERKGKTIQKEVDIK
jgi:general secretion pathway protein C